jgi:hypothetical protein
MQDGAFRFRAVQAFPPSLRYGEARRSAKRGGGRHASAADVNVRTPNALV